MKRRPIIWLGSGDMSTTVQDHPAIADVPNSIVPFLTVVNDLDIKLDVRSCCCAQQILLLLHAVAQVSKASTNA